MAKVNVFGKPIVFDVGATNDGENIVPKILTKNEDLSEFTKKQIARYAADSTISNTYQLDGIFHEIKLSDAEGNPVPVANPDSLAATTQHEPDHTKIDRIDENTVSTASILHKGKGKLYGDQKNGHEFLRDPETINKKYVSTVLNRNRFSSDSPLNQGKYRINPSHPADTKGDYREYIRSTDGKVFEDGHLSHIGALLTMRASRELSAATRTGYGKDGVDGIGASAAALLPGLNQLGVSKVNTSDLTANDVLSQIIAGETEAANLDGSSAFNDRKTIRIGNDSYGQLNNVLDQFSGLAPLGMIATSGALVLALKYSMKGILAVFSLITNAGKASANRKDSIGRYLLGKSSETVSDDSFPPIPLPASLFGLYTTTNQYQNAVNEGIKLFFGDSVGDSFKQVLSSPGFYATFCRSIVRSGATILDAMADVVKGNPIEVAKNIIGLVNIIKTSKIVAVLNMFAQLGDAHLTQLNAQTQITDGRLTSVGSLDDKFSSGHKSRLKGTLRLAWGASTTPSAMLLPNNFLKSLGAYSVVKDSNVNILTPFIMKDAIIDESSTGRLSSEVVQNVENKLDAEYMPFYFHDLRTNEIVSFQAFLHALSDDFSVNWEASDAFGRVDQVKIYKSTQRKISIGFVVVSTNENDFDQMWVKINKLVTMVYPQWTDGTLLKNTEAKTEFIQPFSQMPGASPIIRLRLGDLFRSNYSRFALARLFGVGGKFKANNNELKMSIKRIYDLYSDSFDKGFKVIVAAGSYKETSSKSLGGLAGALSGAAAALGVDLGDKPPVQLILNASAPAEIISDGEENDMYIVKFTSNPVVGDKTFKVHQSQLTIDVSKMKNDFAKYLDPSVIEDVDQDTKQALEDFFNQQSNSIVKSFEHVAGKGLACTIDSLNFGWLDGMIWETDSYVGRAPKMCKVTMNLTPIHDIAPGIDSSGMNRAPVYNVGNVIRGMSPESNTTGLKNFDDKKENLRKYLTRKGS